MTLLQKDEQLTRNIHQFAASRPVWRLLAAFGASELIWIPFGILCFLAFVGQAPGTTLLAQFGVPFLYIACMVGLPWVAVVALEYATRRPRPFQQFPDRIRMLIHMHWSAPSFPSGHATIAFALAAALSTSLGAAPLFFAIAGVIALCRVAVGVHYVSDVLAGAVLGLIGWWVGSMVFTWILGMSGLLSL